jgi:hypothetical protein
MVNEIRLRVRFSSFHSGRWVDLDLIWHCIM